VWQGQRETGQKEPGRLQASWRVRREKWRNRKLGGRRGRGRGRGCSDKRLGGAHRDRGAECSSSLSSEATLFGSNQNFGWMLRGNGISERGKFCCGGRCGGLVKFFNSDGTIWEKNIVGFDIGFPGGNVIRCTLLKQDEEGIMEFTSTGIINPIRNSGERITSLTIFKREKVGGSTRKGKFGSQMVNHFVSGFRGMMENDEAVQRVYNDMFLVVLNFCWKEFIDFLLVIIKFRWVEPGIRRVGAKSR